MTPSPKASEKPVSGSELDIREAEIRQKASDCVIVLDLARALDWPIQSAAAANERFSLGLEWTRPNAAKPRPGVAVPKPVKKSGGGK